MGHEDKIVCMSKRADFTCEDRVVWYQSERLEAGQRVDGFDLSDCGETGG